MLAFAQQVDSTWPARLRAKPLAAVLTLSTEGLVLGAGTVLVAATTPRRLGSLRGQESRVLALLAAAYGKSIAPSVLGNIERAANAWREGDNCLAHIHLGIPDCIRFTTHEPRLIVCSWPTAHCVQPHLPDIGQQTHPL